ncbi:hypothetical protein AKJ08_1746 [Vulgatibacter incomptus]|uniref:Uncharacterized protein n=1 Tax=Vulgatibacter incomptus TaxID=1391653 RepID=A0A0K1PE07_9BACT|nr:hypothetical protein AKJ08_1746 [Vulgatibacter incomptus]
MEPSERMKKSVPLKRVRFLQVALRARALLFVCSAFGSA